MRMFVVLFAVVAAVMAGVVPSEEQKPFASKIFSDIEEELPVDTDGLTHSSFYTRLDHTRPQSRVLVRFNYAANLVHYREGGPFYVYFKDAFESNNNQIRAGLMVDLAMQTGGALFTFDQRYFGSNNLTADNTFENLELLTIEQTLSDVALFVEAIKLAHQGSRSRVIVWGSGYGGTLAAWARKRYPHLVDAAWSSSGTFNLEPFTFSQLDLLEFTLLSSGNEECRNQVKAAFGVLSELIDNDQGEYVQRRLGLCSPVVTDSENDIGFLFESHVSAILTYFNNRHSQGVEEFCTDMNRISGDPLNSFAFWKNYVYGHDLECFDYAYESFVERISQTNVGSPSSVIGSRQWYYITCTQLGMFPITDDQTWLPDRIGAEYHMKKCEDTFGPNYSRLELTPALVHLTAQFGSLQQRITNIIYTNGAIDTWLHNGMMFTRDFNATVINIPFAAKSADLGSITSLDSESLVAAKRQISSFVVDQSIYHD